MKYLEDFITDCIARGLTQSTVATYRCNVRDFLDHIDKDPTEIHMDDLRAFLAHLRTMSYTVGHQQRKGVAPSTLNAYFSAISSYYDFLMWEEIINSNPIPMFRKRYLRFKIQRNGENTRQLASINTMRELLNRSENEILALALITFGAKSGLRKGELIAMNVENLNFKEMEFIVPDKPKRTGRLGFIDDETAVILHKYLEWREPRARTNALWISPMGHRIGVSENGPCEIIKKYARIIGIHDDNGPLNKKFTTHCLRHFFTTHLRRSGMRRELIQELRGDSEKDAIDIYDHIDKEELRKSYLQHIPRFGQVDRCQVTLTEMIQSQSFHNDNY